MRSLTASGNLPVPSSDSLRGQLNCIFASADFVVPDRERRFLKFVIDESLAGRAEYLKAFTVALSVFGRDEFFNARYDPCVRIAASHLRRPLERYYLTSGATDLVLITSPTGGYAPAFAARQTERDQRSLVDQPWGVEVARSPTQRPRGEPPRRESWPVRWIVAGGLMMVFAAVVVASLATGYNAATMVSAPDGRPTIAVERFASTGRTIVSHDVLHGLTDEIIVNLAKRTELVVIDLVDTSGAKKLQPSTYVLQGSVMEGNDIRSIARLVRQADGAVVWTNGYDADIEGRSILGVETELAQSIATAVVAPFAAVARGP